MSGKSAIEWTQMTWNPLSGCTQVSPGCDRCYAMGLHNRRHQIYLKNQGHWSEMGGSMPAQYATPFSKVQLFPERLDSPIHWRQPKMIFVNSMSDLFHKDVPTDFILDVFATMCQANWHIYQVLTKRPSRVTLLAPKIVERCGGSWPIHIWMGTSVESQDYIWRVDKLREVPAPIRFVSAEPLLGPISLNLQGVSWLITGAESTQGARLMDDDWVRLLRDQCVTNGVAFFFKQRAIQGKKVSRPELDGQIWDQMPQEQRR